MIELAQWPSARRICVCSLRFSLCDCISIPAVAVKMQQMRGMQAPVAQAYPTVGHGRQGYTSVPCPPSTSFAASPPLGSSPLWQAAFQAPKARRHTRKRTCDLASRRVVLYDACARAQRCRLLTGVCRLQRVQAGPAANVREKWWTKNIPDNMRTVTSVQDFVDFLVSRG